MTNANLFKTAPRVIKMAGYRNRYEINDEEWEQVKNLLPSEALKKQGRPPKLNRQMLNAILWIAKSGVAWRYLPERYGAWQTVYGKFKKWSDNAVFENIFQILSMDADMQDISLDSSCVKTNQHSAGDKKGL